MNDAADLPTTPEPERAGDRCTLRADAERNRRLIVEAARAVFAERGLDVPLEAIAQRAGVGIATLYRRFPTREDLIAASFADKMAEYAKAAAEALQEPDAWSGFCDYMKRVCAMQANDRGLREVLTLAFSRNAALEAQRAQAYASFVELVCRAQAGGMLRGDFVPEDLVLLLMANAGVVQGMREAAPAAWQRLVGLMIDACRADHASALPPPPTPAQVYRAMRRLSRAPKEAGSRALSCG